MRDDREEFLNGVMAFSMAMRGVNLDPEKATIILSEEDGIRLEHILTQMNHMLISTSSDPRYSQPKADRTVREFKVGGVKFQYRPKLFKLPNGDVL